MENLETPEKRGEITEPGKPEKLQKIGKPWETWKNLEKPGEHAEISEIGKP